MLVKIGDCFSLLETDDYRSNSRLKDTNEGS